MFQRILVPYDGSETSRKGLTQAIELAQTTKGRIKLMHVIDELSLYLAADTYAMVLTDYLGLLKQDSLKLLEGGKAFVEQAGLPCETLLYDSMDSNVCEAVTREAARWPADVIVIGTHGRRGVGRVLMGSSAEQILRHADVPVLLVRAPSDRASDKTAAKAGEQPGSTESVKISVPAGALHVE